MITRAAYKLADLLAALAIRVDRRRIPTAEPFPVAGCLLASACLVGLAAGWIGR